MTPLPYYKLPKPALQWLKKRYQSVWYWCERQIKAINFELDGGVGGHVEATVEPVDEVAMGGDEVAKK